MEEESLSLYDTDNNNNINNNNNFNKNIERIAIYDIVDEQFLKKYNFVTIKEGQKHIVLGETTKKDGDGGGLGETTKKDGDGGGDGGEDKAAMGAEEGEVNKSVIADEDEKLTCWTAPGVVFDSIEQRNLHCKSDWHRLNLKRRQNGEEPFTNQQFELLKQSGAITEESLRILPNSGVHDSDSSSDEPEKPLIGSNRIKFITSDSKQIVVWKNVIIPNPLNRTTELRVLVDSLFVLPEKKSWAIFMSSGGRFAGGIFDCAMCVKHKTFVRYTVRKKQGGSQSTKDNKSGTSAPKSAGATMRRYNEKRFREQISEILTDWSELISKTHFIFLYAPGQNWNFFFAGENGLKRGDNRIRSVPFTVKKPTLAEVKKIHEILTKIEISDYDPQSDITEQENQHQHEHETLEKKSINKLEENKISTETPTQPQEEVEDKISTAIINNDIDALTSLFDSDYEMPVHTDVKKITTPVYLAVQYNRLKILEYLLDLDTGDLDTPIPGWYHRTALHRAAFDEKQEFVELLLDSGASPSPKDIHLKTPYVISSPQMREFMRKYAAQNLEKHPWVKLGITPLTPEIEEEKKQKLSEKKKKKKQHAKKNKQEKKRQQEEEDEKEKLAQEKEALEKKIHSAALERASKIANMSDREKRAYAAESRLAANTGKSSHCDYCNVPILTVPFERLEYKYCSTDCVRKHMDVIDKVKVIKNK